MKLGATMKNSVKPGTRKISRSIKTAAISWWLECRWFLHWLLRPRGWAGEGHRSLGLRKKKWRKSPKNERRNSAKSMKRAGQECASHTPFFFWRFFLVFFLLLKKKSLFDWQVQPKVKRCVKREENQQKKLNERINTHTHKEAKRGSTRH